MAHPRRWPRGYYTYVMRWPDGTPYYVGAGKGNRGNPMLKKFVGRCIEKELRAVGQTSVVEIMEADSKAEAFLLEEKLIREIGRQDLGTGPLFNRTDGRGARGYVYSEETKEKLSRGQRGRKQTEAQKEATRLRMTGNKHLLGHVVTTETRLKMSAALRGRKLQLSPEERQRRSAAMIERNRSRPPRKGLECSPGHKRKLSEARRET